MALGSARVAEWPSVVGERATHSVNRMFSLYNVCGYIKLYSISRENVLDLITPVSGHCLLFTL